MRGIEWGAPRRLSVVVAVILAMLMALPAGAWDSDSSWSWDDGSSWSWGDSSTNSSSESDDDDDDDDDDDGWNSTWTVTPEDTSTTSTVDTTDTVSDPTTTLLNDALTDGSLLVEPATELSSLVFSEPGSLYDVAQRIGLVDAYGHTLVNATGAGVTVAMIDTGVVDVPGLRNSNVAIGPDFSFEDANPDLRSRDSNGHGTHLAGILAGTDAAWTAGDTQRSPERAIGVAPDVELLSEKASPPAL